MIKSLTPGNVLEQRSHIMMRSTSLALSVALVLGGLSGAIAANNPNRGQNEFVGGRHMSTHAYRSYGYTGRYNVPGQRHPAGFPNCWGGNCDPRWGHDHF